MRNRTYRRKQEAKHFKKRVLLNLSLYKGKTRYSSWREYKNADKNYLLKNGNLYHKSDYGWINRENRRCHRHFYKQGFEYFPDHYFITRCKISPHKVMRKYSKGNKRDRKIRHSIIAGLKNRYKEFLSETGFSEKEYTITEYYRDLRLFNNL